MKRYGGIPMILQKKEELANRQLRLTITVERDAWEKALNLSLIHI